MERHIDQDDPRASEWPWWSRERRVEREALRGWGHQSWSEPTLCDMMTVDGIAGDNPSPWWRS